MIKASGDKRSLRAGRGGRGGEGGGGCSIITGQLLPSPRFRPHLGISQSFLSPYNSIDGPQVLSLSAPSLPPPSPAPRNVVIAADQDSSVSD